MSYNFSTFENLNTLFTSIGNKLRNKFDVKDNVDIDTPDSFPYIKKKRQFIPKTWSEFSVLYGNYIWTDGTNTYYSDGEGYQYKLNDDTWESIIWDNFNDIIGRFVWTDGTNIYYSTPREQYKLNGTTWEAITWEGGFIYILGTNIWTDGMNTYYSYDSDQYVLNGTIWVEKTWEGLNNFRGEDIWTDGTNIYYSSENQQYVLNGTTWIEKEWKGINISYFLGRYVWTDGIDIYYSVYLTNTTSNYVLVTDDTWIPVTWEGIKNFYGNMIWTDGKKTYYSYEGNYELVPIKEETKRLPWSSLISLLSNTHTHTKSNITDYGGATTFYGTCAADQAANQTKIVTISSDQKFSLQVGVVIGVKFDATNTYLVEGVSDVCKLNVNSSGAKPIYAYDLYTPGTNPVIYGKENCITYYMYNGQYWLFINSTDIDYIPRSMINALDVTGPSYIMPSKTISSWSETDGKVKISTQDISITKSQVSDFPTIPTVNDGTLTIQKNGTSVGTFTANANTNKTINITVPVLSAPTAYIIRESRNITFSTVGANQSASQETEAIIKSGYTPLCAIFSRCTKSNAIVPVRCCMAVDSDTHKITWYVWNNSSTAQSDVILYYQVIWIKDSW